MEEKKYKIAVFPGDGIGPEIIREALKVIRVISESSGVTFEIEKGLVGGGACDQHGEPLPEKSLSMALGSDAVLLGAVGGPKWESLPHHLKPERALLGLRKRLGLFANLRPVVAFKELLDASPLKSNVINDIDIMIIRELTGDAYFGQPRGIIMEKGLRIGINTIIYSEEEIRRIVRVAFEAAIKRRKSLVSVDKANVLESS
ncbi:MAG: 3-isopropylmalate dehydrogenase, partial [Syntrophobacterales bacterium CG_4_9_14_3_um_filter_49_8]